MEFLPFLVEVDPIDMTASRHFALSQSADEDIILPIRELVSCVERQSGWGDRRDPEDDRRLHFLLVRFFGHARAKVETAKADNRPSVILSWQKNVDFIATIRAGLARVDLAPDARVAIALSWHGDPDHPRIAAAAAAIMAAVAPHGQRSQPLLLMIDGDIGKTMGRIMTEELGFSGDLVSIDGVQLAELEFVDVGELISPPGVVPVVIKSLLFS